MLHETHKIKHTMHCILMALLIGVSVAALTLALMNVPEAVLSSAAVPEIDPEWNESSGHDRLLSPAVIHSFSVAVLMPVGSELFAVHLLKILSEQPRPPKPARFHATGLRSPPSFHI